MKKHVYKISFNLKGTKEEVIKEAMKFWKNPLFYDCAVIMEGDGKQIAIVNEDKKIGTRYLKKIISKLNNPI
ncbi:hypothetical protein KO465_05795 [Candidatus Micrarchaeota archaeon]|nr:hypothetical protein [Candidatus Micrarchaeota archaeon]